MTEATLLVDEPVDGVLRLTLNRPAARNAIDRDLASRIADALDCLDRDPDLRVGVVAANGPAFCAGMDLKAFVRGESPIIEGRGFAGIVARPSIKPLVAVVEGPAVGGGFEIVLACDLVVASRRASFGLPEVTRGLTPSGGGMFKLGDRLGRHHVLELILTGAPIDAEQADALGLLNRLTDDGAAMQVALELATRIAANAPLAIVAAKRVITEAPGWPLADRFDRQESIVDPVRSSADAVEGATAFAEKRRPVWRSA